ncbi:MAG: urease accessory protein UreE [Aestuariivirga sp.]|uniref:urease accessory protein UreE n=1 Tax=Aestuariivirga sp. TaxID=2650926 RepID=UPI0038D1D55F
MTRRATSFRRAAAPGDEPFDLVTLDADQRHIRRKRITLAGGEDILVDFEKPAHLEHGDRLVLEDGRVAQVVAAQEELMEVKAASPRHLTELAWHIGNRHLPAQICDGRILLRRDPVIRAMLETLGATLRDVVEPFSPQHGAYHSHAH